MTDVLTRHTSLEEINVEGEDAAAPAAAPAPPPLPLRLTPFSLSPAHQPSCVPPDNVRVTNAGWAALAAGLRRSLAVKKVYGVDLTKHDDTLPEHVLKENSSRGNEAVLAYYKDRAAHGTTTVCKFRAMLVGESGAGKTTLSRKLANTELPAPTSSTHGVETS